MVYGKRGVGSCKVGDSCKIRKHMPNRENVPPFRKTETIKFLYLQGDYGESGPLG